MNNHIIDLADTPARLSTKLEQLVITMEDDPPQSVPLKEIAVVVLTNPQITITQPALAGLADYGAAVIVCDRASLPVSLSLPLAGNFIQTRRMADQASAPKPINKRLWKQIIQSKIQAQAQTLKKLNLDPNPLNALVPQVRSGDTANVEARASRKYWQLLFAHQTKPFRRDREAKDQNQLLNYGYAIIRAIIARAITAVGLHPAIGIHHHNQYNAYPLADDLIEPFRPLVDYATAQYIQENGTPESLDKNAKSIMLTTLISKYRIQNEMRTLFDIASQLTNSLVSIYENREGNLRLPQW